VQGFAADFAQLFTTVGLLGIFAVITASVGCAWLFGLYQNGRLGELVSKGRRSPQDWRNRLIPAVSFVAAAGLAGVILLPAGSGSDTPEPDAPGAAPMAPTGPPCPTAPVTIAVGSEQQFSCVGAFQVVVPRRWTLHAVAQADSYCDVGIDATATSPARSSHGVETLVHRRDPGPHTIRLSRTCVVTLAGSDDLVQPLPLDVARTSQGGATALFQAHGFIRVATSGPARCNATLFDDTGQKQGHQAEPGNPLDINVNGTYWVVSEQNDCGVGISQLAPP